MSQERKRNHHGFTVIELLVVIAVIVMAAGLTLPAVQKGRQAEERTQTMNNLSQCAKAVHLTHDQFKKYPPYYGIYGAKTTAFTFHVHLLPFVDQGPLYNKPDPKAVVPAYLSPMDLTKSDKGAGAANFPVNLRLYYTKGGTGELSKVNAMIYPKMPGTFQDGVSQTLLFATKYMNCGKDGGSMWMDPGNNALESPKSGTFGASMRLWQSAPKKEDCNATSGTAVSFTAQAIQVAMCDASVRSVAMGITKGTWEAVHTPAAGDVPGADWVE